MGLLFAWAATFDQQTFSKNPSLTRRANRNTPSADILRALAPKAPIPTTASTRVQRQSGLMPILLNGLEFQSIAAGPQVEGSGLSGPRLHGYFMPEKFSKISRG